MAAPHVPLRTAVFRRANQYMALMLCQHGSSQTELLWIREPLGTATVTDARTLSLRDGHDLFEQTRLSWLCEGYHIDDDARTTWRSGLRSLVGDHAAELRTDLQQRSAPISERELSSSDFREALTAPGAVVQLRRSGDWGLLTTTDYDLNIGILPASAMLGVRWQECLGDIGGVSVPTPFTALFRIDAQGVCALVDLLSYDGKNLKHTHPRARFALLQQLIAELRGAGARWGSWQLPEHRLHGPDLVGTPAAWESITVCEPNSLDRLIFNYPG